MTHTGILPGTAPRSLVGAAPRRAFPWPREKQDAVLITCTATKVGGSWTRGPEWARIQHDYGCWLREIRTAIACSGGTTRIAAAILAPAELPHTE